LTNSENALVVIPCAIQCRVETRLSGKPIQVAADVFHQHTGKVVREPVPHPDAL
jgi:hypothetical protein